ncbi:hypothetical protein [Acidovorax sp. Leaf78]|uniref:hypothetical protein n=1 Tax=Acidovorax sp. Leaf78 TaxID=1736237 RepID=UPI0006FD59C8|nr:hypothetical protein [Acidovorax sp. Leaf78]KQO24480.1 hypothetical protein ASF16_22555 [Acidovorax sp. Leaf78]
MDKLSGLLSRPSTAASGWLARAGLPAPPLAQGVVHALEPLASHLFASGVAAQWAELDPDQAFQAWSSRGGSVRGDAVLGIIGSGLHARLRCYSAGPDVALFMQRDWSPAGDGAGTAGATPAMAVEGAFTLARLLQERAAAARADGRWPEGRTLVLVDDAFGSQPQRWGWTQPGRAASLDDLAADGDAYLSALVSVRAL